LGGNRGGGGCDDLLWLLCLLCICGSGHSGPRDRC
jgi:hypothetical protein